jgi:hypothetical protein
MLVHIRSVGPVLGPKTGCSPIVEVVRATSRRLDRRSSTLQKGLVGPNALTPGGACRRLGFPSQINLMAVVATLSDPTVEPETAACTRRVAAAEGLCDQREKTNFLTSREKIYRIPTFAHMLKTIQSRKKSRRGVVRGAGAQILCARTQNFSIASG